MTTKPGLGRLGQCIRIKQVDAVDFDGGRQDEVRTPAQNVLVEVGPADGAQQEVWSHQRLEPVGEAGRAVADDVFLEDGRVDAALVAHLRNLDSGELDPTRVTSGPFNDCAQTGGVGAAPVWLA